MCFATVVGLDNAMSGELVYVVSQDTQESQNETTENTETFKDLATEISIGMVFNLQEDQVGILILEVSTKGVKEGDIVYGTDMLPSVKFSPNTFGKIINH
ncbi:MAG: hypothetical protein ACXWFB_11745 [Nitrososphaeraceae archaeon]